MAYDEGWDCPDCGVYHPDRGCLDGEVKAFRSGISYAEQRQDGNKSDLSGWLASLAELKEHYRLVDIGDGDYGIYLKEYNVRCATIRKGSSGLVRIIQEMMAC